MSSRQNEQMIFVEENVLGICISRFYPQANLYGHVWTTHGKAIIYRDRLLATVTASLLESIELGTFVRCKLEWNQRLGCLEVTEVTNVEEQKMDFRIVNVPSEKIIMLKGLLNLEAEVLRKTEEDTFRFYPHDVLGVVKVSKKLYENVTTKIETEFVMVPGSDDQLPRINGVVCRWQAISSEEEADFLAAKLAYANNVVANNNQQDRQSRSVSRASSRAPTTPSSSRSPSPQLDLQSSRAIVVEYGNTNMIVFLLDRQESAELSWRDLDDSHLLKLGSEFMCLYSTIDDSGVVNATRYLVEEICEILPSTLKTRQCNEIEIEVLVSIDYRWAHHEGDETTPAVVSSDVFEMVSVKDSIRTTPQFQRQIRAYPANARMWCRLQTQMVPKTLIEEDHRGYDTNENGLRDMWTVSSVWAREPERRPEYLRIRQLEQQNRRLQELLERSVRALENCYRSFANIFGRFRRQAAQFINFNEYEAEIRGIFRDYDRLRPWQQ